MPVNRLESAIDLLLEPLKSPVDAVGSPIEFLIQRVDARGQRAAERVDLLI